MHASIDMWLYMKWVIIVAELANKVFDDNHSKVVKAGKVPQDHTAYGKNKEIADRRARAAEDRAKVVKDQLSKMRGSLKATESAPREGDVAKKKCWWHWRRPSGQKVLKLWSSFGKRLLNISHQKSSPSC